MAHGFIIKCLKCGDEDCRVETFHNGEFIEVQLVCDNPECGQTE
jgi:hypothetical protein